jgi:glycosyltransferase involved in cell wall biosynthesis
MKFTFWCSLALILYCYIGYPALIWLLASLRAKGWTRAPFAGSVSIVMAVRNGAVYLPAKLAALRSMADARIKEIILVSDGSTDDTAQQLTDWEDQRCKVILLHRHQGKAVALNAGMAAATSDLLLFLDVRPELTASSLQELISNFADPHVGCAAGELTLRRDGHGVTASAVSGLYWRYEQWIRHCEAKWDSPVGVYGGFYAVRRTLATPLPPGTILDDMYQPLAVIRQGYRSVLDGNACIHDTWPKATAPEFDRKVRTLAGNFQLFQLAPWLFTFQNRVILQLISHKVLRLVVPYCFASLLLTSLFLSHVSLAYAIFAAGQAAWWTLSVVSLRFTLPLFARLGGTGSALLLLNAAAVVGFYRFLVTRQQLWKIWKAPQSSGDIEDGLQEPGGAD